MTNAEGLSCKEIVELVTDYLEGTMLPARRLGFEQHVAICPPCRNYFGQFRQTIALGRTIEEDELPPDLRAGLLDAFRDWRET